MAVVLKNVDVLRYLREGVYVPITDKGLVRPLSDLGLKWITPDEIVIETNREFDEYYEITAYLKSGWKVTARIYKNGKVEARISHACSPRTVDVLR